MILQLNSFQECLFLFWLCLVFLFLSYSPFLVVLPRKWGGRGGGGGGGGGGGVWGGGGGGGGGGGDLHMVLPSATDPFFIPVCSLDRNISWLKFLRWCLFVCL